MTCAHLASRPFWAKVSAASPAIVLSIVFPDMPIRRNTELLAAPGNSVGVRGLNSLHLDTIPCLVEWLNRRENLSIKLSNGPLEILHFVCPSQIKGPHVPNVLGRESGHPGKLLLKVRRKSLNDRLTPSLGTLPTDNNLPNIPIELNWHKEAFLCVEATSGLSMDREEAVAAAHPVPCHDG